MKKIEVKHLQKKFGDLQVLKDVNFDVEEGEVVVLIGPSGCGKSTILRCLNKLETISGGSIAISGEVFAHTTARGVEYAGKEHQQKIICQMGMVFQQFNLFPHMTVLENIIEAPLRVQKRNRDEVIEEAKQLLRKVGLEEKIDAYPLKLSGGQQQRVAIARALAMKPDIMFFDEPTSALDPELTNEILKIMRVLAEENMTMLIVTHAMNFARDVANRILFVADGCIQVEGTPQEVFENTENERLKAFLQAIKEQG